jgi:hypothetical protein
MNQEEIRYTQHAFDRMTERDISRAMVEAVVFSGRMEREEIGDVRRYRLEGLIVVLDGQNVVTVYFDSDERKHGKWSPKKRQRRGRNGEMKPHFIAGRGKINIRQQEYYLRKMEK